MFKTLNNELQERMAFYESEKIRLSEKLLKVEEGINTCTILLELSEEDLYAKYGAVVAEEQKNKESIGSSGTVIAKLLD